MSNIENALFSMGLLIEDLSRVEDILFLLPLKGGDRHIVQRSKNYNRGLPTFAAARTIVMISGSYKQRIPPGGAGSARPFRSSNRRPAFCFDYAASVIDWRLAPRIRRSSSWV
jgi:hypothetical protein